MIYQHLDLKADTIFSLDFKANITVIMGNSGSGKTYLFNTVRSMVRNLPELSNIVCCNKDSVRRGFTAADFLKGVTNSLIFIDNADIILTELMRNSISADTSNQYLINCHNPYGFLLSPYSAVDLIIENGVGRFRHFYNK